jgi:hypothetical protein
VSLVLAICWIATWKWVSCLPAAIFSTSRLSPEDLQQKTKNNLIYVQTALTWRLRQYFSENSHSYLSLTSRESKSLKNIYLFKKAKKILSVLYA